jgi:outer membrane protein assembly factor BamA
MLASRLIASVGIPYGNSTVLPYIRQFFAGGSNSIRAFSARSVGPGSYFPADTTSFFLVDQSGDIKLEANVEYRFPIVKYLKGALFIDAGNIWLINDDPNRPGGEFDIDKFLSELAIGVGYGLRFDMDILVLRFDWAFPIRKPYLPEGNRWNDIDFFDPDWRNKNMILNISIGYPF